MQVVKRSGKVEPFDVNKVVAAAKFAQGSLTVDVEAVAKEAIAQLYDRCKTAEIQKSLILSARAKIVKDPDYSRYAAALLLQELYHEAFGCKFDAGSFEAVYRNKFEENLRLLVDAKRIDPVLLERFDLDRLADALVPDRDKKFNYLATQTLYDRYLIHIEGRRMETCQAFWMRVACGVAIEEDDPTGRAIEFYNLMSQFLYCPSTPTLFNSGTLHPQMSSCYLSTMEDSIDGIYGTLHEQARLSKYAGGLGVDVTPLRAAGSRIKGTNGTSDGLIPWAVQFNQLSVAVNQGGKRKGAICLYAEPWHYDFEDFLDLRKSTGDSRRRAVDLHLASWIPDLFMERVEQDGQWTMLCPSENPKLHDCFADDFKEEYIKAEKRAEAGELKVCRKVNAKDLWKKMLRSVYETAYPFFCFKCPSNARYSDQHLGFVHSSNLCTEIVRHTLESKWKDGVVERLGETAVCNLGSVNLIEHVSDGSLDLAKLAATIKVAVRMLDDVISGCYYPIKPAEESNLKHRPIGMGIMAEKGLLHSLKLSPDSDEAVELADRVTEFVTREAILASCDLAKERGKYSTYEGSLWSKGLLPLDTYNEFITKHRGGEPVKGTLNWDEVREKVAKFGVRNGSICAIAPTATISYIMGCEPSIDPDFSCLFVYSTLSGDFTMINEHLVKRLKEQGLWTDAIVDDLIRADGDVSLLNLPLEIKEEFKTAHNCDQHKLIDAAARRQIWLDQSQSLNLYTNTDSLKALNDMYFHAHKRGLKTTYYLRNKAASKIEKTSSIKEVVAEPKVCSINNPGCESCQ